MVDFKRICASMFIASYPEAKKRYGEIADYKELGGKDDGEKVVLLINYLCKMNDDLKIPHCIKYYGIDSFPTAVGFVLRKSISQNACRKLQKCYSRCMYRIRSSSARSERNGRTA